MNHIQDTVTTDDFRRAAAAVQHAGRFDGEGIAAIIDEATELGRLPQLLYAQAYLPSRIIPFVVSETGAAWVNQFIAEMSLAEQQ